MTEPERRCVVCARSGELHLHHLAGRSSLPSVEVPVCETRHAAWHRRLRAAGVQIGLSGDTSRLDALRAIALGMRVILEDGAAVCEDPASVRASTRARAELELRLIDAARSTGRDTRAARIAAAPSPRSQSPGSPEGERARDCQARTPRSSSERIERLAAFLAGTLPAIAALLEDILPAELAHLRLPQRLRGIDPLSLSRARLDRAGPGCSGILDALLAGGIPALAELGEALDELVAELQRAAQIASELEAQK